MRTGAAIAAACFIYWHRRSLPRGRRFFGPVALLFLAVPYEYFLADVFDPWLQATTAELASPLVRCTGLEVYVDQEQLSLIRGEDLVVHVSSLCAGMQTFLSLMTLCVVLIELFGLSLRYRLVFLFLAPVVGYFGNVLRVAISVHAAHRFVGHGNLWPIAHDLIGYTIFFMTYGLLFAVIRRARRKKISI